MTPAPTTPPGLAYARENFDLATSFKITGSPTMLTNGEIVRESHFATNDTNTRSPEAVKDLLCCGLREAIVLLDGIE